MESNGTHFGSQLVITFIALALFGIISCAGITVPMDTKLSETEINTSVGENAFPYNLEKYLGDHTVYKIEDYTRTSDGKWTIANIENSIAGVFLFKNQIHFKRNNSQLVGVRLFSYKKFSSGFYIFSSNNGETYIDKDFKKIIFFDEEFGFSLFQRYRL